MPTFHIEQFGCRATQADAAALERQLRDRGATLAPDARSADFVIVNTCTVTSAADTQVRDAIRKIHARNPRARIIATGCYAQRAPEDLAALAGVTHVVGNSHKPEIPQLLASATSANFVPASSLGVATRSIPEKILVGNIFNQTSLLAAPILGGEANHTRPILKIQDGCNLRCSYCVIPFVRGKSRSLPPQQTLDEIRQLTAAGHQEVVLSGINLGMYGRDLTPRTEFEDLLRRILDETEIPRLRISSIEPMDVTADLIALFASTDRLARHFHMPLQSASNAILAAMHRWYRAEHYARRLELIREQIPDAAIGADVITGFPSETEADHQATLAFIEQHPFTYLHVFSYSSRPGTKAASRTDHLDPATIHRRARELRALSEKKSAAFYASQSGKPLQVLTLCHSQRPNADSSPAASPPNVAVHLTCVPTTQTGVAHNEISPARDRLPSNPSSAVQSWTPAISSNYLQIRLPGSLPPNQLLSVQATSANESSAHYLNAQPETIPAITP
jgi:threonylcarbamoyladenosine tRNA methylthiotransferase MtaB